MTKGLKWRIYVLQAGLIGIFAFCSGFLFWTSSFIGGQVHDQLSQQQIFFPQAGTPALTALPASDRTAMEQYGGQQLTTGDQAKVYANSFIGVHLTEVAGGQTYSQVSAQAQANPSDTKLAGQVQTLFRGETLRGLLLNAYGWSTVGVYAFYAAIGLAVASFAVLLAFLYELVIAPRRVSEKTPAVVPLGAPLPTA